MKISEIFLSIDGEGKRAGLPTVFVRLFYCNLRCSYCDSLYAIDDKQGTYTEMTMHEVIEKIESYKIKSITITGGEPLYCSEIDKLLSLLSDKGYDINVETNGSIDVSNHRYRNVWFTVDYKCPSSLMESKMLLDQYNDLHSEDVIKFVIGSQEDLETAYKLSCKFHNKTKAQIYWSPVFNTISYSDIVDYIIKNRLYFVKFQLQLHKFIWDPNKRGV